MRRWGLVLLSLIALTGCATDYVGRTRAIRTAYESHDDRRALELIDEELEEGARNDELLLLLDKGMVLHAAGRWEESIQVLAKADRLSQQLDAISISEEAGALLANERHRAYRGEDFEKLMISTLQALNYAQLGKDEDALVEVRRVNERIRKMVAEEGKPYEQLAIARYLGGVLYEDQREWDSAFIDYQEAAKLHPELGGLAEPLLRLARKTGRTDVYEALQKRYPSIREAELGPGDGQLVVIIEAGRSPQKEQDQVRHRRGGVVELVAVPRFRDRGAPAQTRLRIGERELTAIPMTSLTAVAKLHLNDRVGRILAQALASATVKAGVAAGVGSLTRSQEIGLLTFLVLSAANQADLRSWLSLPAEFQVARAPLPKGRHPISVDYGGHVTQHEVEIRPGRISLLVLRRY